MAICRSSKRKVSRETPSPTSDLLVVEADESDGTLVRYAPAIGVILNLQRDHRETAEVAAMFATLRARTREMLVAGDAETLDRFAGSALRSASPTGPISAARRSSSTQHRMISAWRTWPSCCRSPARTMWPCPPAAIAAASVVGVELADMAEPLAAFKGIGRRFQTIGKAHGIEVVDDFAHNAEKIAAAIRTARLRSQRVLAIYQPHGYGPTRFLRHDFVRIFASELEPHDRLWMLEVFYAGGTATRDFSAADIVAEIGAKGAHAEFAPSRQWLVARIAEEARPGDLVLLMGARDPSLTELARAILAAIESATASASAK